MIRWWVISIEQDMGTLHNTEFVDIQLPTSFCAMFYNMYKHFSSSTSGSLSHIFNTFISFRNLNLCNCAQVVLLKLYHIRYLPYVVKALRLPTIFSKSATSIFCD